MNISLTKEFEHYVTQKVESGMYHSASEVIRDGLRLMKERDELHQSKLAELRKEIAIGLTRPTVARRSRSMRKPRPA